MRSSSCNAARPRPPPKPPQKRLPRHRRRPHRLQLHLPPRPYLGPCRSVRARRTVVFVASCHCANPGQRQDAHSQSGPVISHEAGFESWLIKRTGAEQPAANQRLTFGKIGKTNTAGTEPEVEADESRAASDEDEQKGERFLKPGSSKRSAQAEGKAAKKQRRRGEDKVVIARKRGGKPGISGGR